MSTSSRTDTRRFFIPWLMILILGVSVRGPQAEAADDPAPLEQMESIGLFYGIEFQKLVHILQSMHPSEIVFADDLDHSPLSSALFDLAQYMANNIDSLSPNEVLAQIPKYKRVEMFGTWVNEDSQRDCYNTRAEVLIRDATPGARIDYAPANPCQVKSGTWHDPYTDSEYRLASAVQIDHFVPLKNAYRSGAHSWTRERRCSYANFLGDRQHLLAVSGQENMSKGDSGPEEYIPPNENYTCAYVANWMRVKAVWNLRFSRDEASAIQKIRRDHHCATSETQLDLQTFHVSRTSTTATNQKCIDPGI